MDAVSIFSLVSSWIIIRNNEGKKWYWPVHCSFKQLTWGCQFCILITIITSKIQNLQQKTNYLTIPSNKWRYLLFQLRIISVVECPMGCFTDEPLHVLKECCTVLPWILAGPLSERQAISDGYFPIHATFFPDVTLLGVQVSPVLQVIACSIFFMKFEGTVTL